MFPLGKLRELSPKTRIRKIARILQGMELEIDRGLALDVGYVRELLGLAGGERGARAAAEAVDAAADPERLRRVLNGMRHSLLTEIGAEPSEWDLLEPGTGELDRSKVPHHPIVVYLEDLRSPFNVGSIFRTSEAFGVGRILLSPSTPAPTHPRAQKTARGAVQGISWERKGLESLRGTEGLFALELGGTDINEFPFPPRGAVLVGSEELGLSPEALEMADKSLGRVSIPLIGAKRSLNVSVAFGILMQAWHSALSRGASPR